LTSFSKPLATFRFGDEGEIPFVKSCAVLIALVWLWAASLGLGAAPEAET
jgi:hypothetical protein